MINGKKVVFLKNGASAIGHSNVFSKMNLEKDFSPFSNNNTQRILYLKVKLKTLKLIEENIGVNLYDFGFSGEFLDTTPKS